MEEDSNRSIFNKILSFMNKHHLQNGTDLADEINDLIDEGQAKGFITDEESDMVHGVLELKETTALSIMIPRTDLTCASIDTTLGELINLITTCGHTRIPIYGESIDEIIGILHAKDLLKLFGSPPETKITPDILRKAFFVPGSQKISILLRDLKTRKNHMAVVTDEYGGTEGIITIEDILEEIVGEIMDEHDHEDPLMSRIDAHTILVDARLDAEELEEIFGIKLPDGDFESVGGFIINILGKIPRAGEELVYDKLKIQIKSADERRIDKALITCCENMQDESTGPFA
ncbi:MAG: HlyC/CorC family transporter [Deltaproteobacteria bacterium]|nr:HlyC/CorC family transporter [Deltaproteobacteria bacterium]